MTEDEYRQRHGKQDVIEHPLAASQIEEIVLRVVCDREKEAAGTADPGEMIEADARELGKRDRKDREVNAGDTEAERKEADHRSDCAGNRKRRQQSDPRAYAELHIESGGYVGAKADIKRMSER